MNKYLKRTFAFSFIFLSVIMLVSCKEQSVAAKEQQEMERADMQYAYRLLENDEKMKAAEIFEQVIKKEPDNARAHLELAIIYHQTNDFVNAMYYYRKYAKMQPNSQKINMVKEQYRRAKKEFLYLENKKGVKYIKPEPEKQSSKTNNTTNDLQIVKDENEQLKESLKEKEAQIAELEGVIKSQAKILRSKVLEIKALRESQPKIQRYTVTPGEHLRSIAVKIYGNEEKWKTLYDANKERLNLKSADNIQPGQVLIIPWDDNNK